MNLDPQKYLREILDREYEQSKKRNQSYSKKAFAKRLKTSSGALSEILAGKRKVSRSMAMQFLQILACKAEETAMLIEMFESEGRLDGLREYHHSDAEELLGEKHFKFMADWRYFTVLGFCKLDSYIPSNSNSISEKLALSAHEIESILEDLAAAKFLEKDAEGCWHVLESAVFRTPPNYPESLMANRLIDSNTGANAAIANPEGWHHGAHAITRVDTKKIPEAERMIEEFVKKLCLFLSSDSTSEIFELNVNLYPRSFIQCHPS